MRIYFTLLYLLTHVLYAQVSIISQFSGLAKEGNKGELEVHITKNNINSFAKYQIEIPPGVYISDIDVKGGHFSVDGNKAKVVWVNLPAQSEFTIKLRITFNYQLSFPVTLYQKFYYLENSVKKEVQAEPLVINFFGNNTDVAINNTSSPSSLSANESKHLQKTNPTNNTNPHENKISTTQPKEEIKNTGQENKSKEINNTNQVTTIQHYTYKIQIAASASKPDESAYQNIGEKIEVIQHKGMYKIMIDKIFTSKEEALQFRERMIQKGYTGAFLVKYLNGQRVN